MFKAALLLSALTQVWAAPVAEPVAIDTGLSRRATGPNYNQNYIAGGANVQYSPNVAAGTFTVNWNTNADFVVGLGWTKGDTTPVTYSGSFSVKSGTPGGLLSLYGWTTSPLVEYYVVENPGNGYSTGGTHKGTVVSDGATYDIWLHQQVNQPSIQGTSTFNQYISIRQTPRSSGTVTLQNHFTAWAGLGMTLGTFNYQTISVESWSGSGSASLSVSKGAGTGTGTGGVITTTNAPSPTTTTAPPASSPTSGSVAHYGQCGGQGWQGATTCAAPYTCKAASQYYSQCL